MGEEARITGAGRSLARREALMERVENSGPEGHSAATDTFYENPNRRAVSRNPDSLVEATESRLAGADLSAILLTGASGQAGGALVEELVRRGAKIRAMARTEERAAGLAALGVDAVVGDFERHYPALAPALRGVKNASGPSWARAGCEEVYEAQSGFLDVDPDGVSRSRIDVISPVKEQHDEDKPESTRAARATTRPARTSR